MKEVELVRGVDAAAAVHKPILKRHGTIVFSMTVRTTAHVTSAIWVIDSDPRQRIYRHSFSSSIIQG